MVKQDLTWSSVDRENQEFLMPHPISKECLKNDTLQKLQKVTLEMVFATILGIYL